MNLDHYLRRVKDVLTEPPPFFFVIIANLEEGYKIFASTYIPS